MKKLNKFLIFTMLELSVVGIIFFLIGLRSGADIDLITSAIKDRSIAFFQWIIRLV